MTSHMEIPGPLGRRPRRVRARWVRGIRPLAAMSGELSVRALDILLALAGLVFRPLGRLVGR